MAASAQSSCEILLYFSEQLLEECNFSLLTFFFRTRQRSYYIVSIFYLQMDGAIFIKTSQFVLKYFALITASLLLQNISQKRTVEELF